MNTTKRLLALVIAVIMALSLNLSVLAVETPWESSTNSETKSDVIVTEFGVYINGVFYTQEQFTQLLDTAQGIPQTRAAIAAGTWWIPGVGQVIVTATGVILLAGAIVEAGTWLYEVITDWLANASDKSVEEAYEEAKEEGEPTDNHSTQPSSEGGLSRSGEPWSSKDLIDNDGVKQRRYYDGNGNADEDIDYHHPGSDHEFPHRHVWSGPNRGPAIPY